MGLARRILGRVGALLSSRTTFAVALVAFSLAANHAWRYRNALDDYPGGRGFPFLLHFDRADSQGRDDYELSQLPLRTSRYGRGRAPHLLPASIANAGVHASTYVHPQVMEIGPDHIRVRMRYYGHTQHTPWDVAVYEATADGITPLYINGGSSAASWPVNIAMGAILAWVLRCAGRGCAYAARHPPREWVGRLRSARWFEDPFALIVLAPFVYYGSVLTARLTPYNMADSYAYLWRRTLNGHFLTGRSLTQRIVYTLCSSNLRTITVVQLLAFALTALLIYSLLRPRGGLLYRFLLACAVTFLFASHTLNIAAITVAAEPLFVALMLAFPVILFLWPRRFWSAAVLLGGILFIFSKNVAAFAVIPLLFVRLALWPHPHVRRLLPVFATLAVFAVASIWTTQRFDRSIPMNVLNNICRRVLPDAEATAWFRERYGLPTGDYAKQLADGDCNTRLDGRPLYTVNPTTLNFELLPDAYGLTGWVGTHGARAYTRYLLLDRPMATLGEFVTGYRDVFASDAVRYTTMYAGPMDWRVGHRQNLERLTNGDARKAVGYFGFDPLVKTRDLLARLGFGHAGWVVFYVLVGAVLSRLAPADGGMPLAVGLLVLGLGTFFLAYFGDAAAVERHTLPALIALMVGGILYLLALGEMAWRQILARTRRAQPPQAPPAITSPQRA